MKKIFKNPVFIIGGSLILLIALVLYFSTNASAQTKPDSIQVYTFTVLPQTLNMSVKVIQDICIPKGSTTKDTLVCNSLLNMIYGNGKMIKIPNPEKQKLPIKSK